MMNVDRFLARIGLPELRGINEDSLCRLTRAFLEHIPFESLTVSLLHRIPELDEDALYRKIVEDRRGGYCFELNKAFYLLLRALKFEAYPVGVRNMYKKSELAPVLHRSTVIYAGGERFFCCVGSCTGPKGPVRMDTEEAQSVFGKTFRFRREGKYIVLQVEEDGVFTKLYQFIDEPYEEIDFAVGNYYCAAPPAGVFCERRVCQICLPDGMIFLNGRELSVTHGRDTVTRSIGDREELALVLREDFGLDYYVPYLSEYNF